MKVRYESSFEKDLKKIRDKKLLVKIKYTILELKEIKGLSSISSISKLKGYDTYYRIRINDYRIGIEYHNDEVLLTRLLHRKDVYRYFQ